MAGRLQDKVAVVTGGASGIGEGMVRRFCSEGALAACSTGSRAARSAAS